MLPELSTKSVISAILIKRRKTFKDKNLQMLSTVSGYHLIHSLPFLATILKKQSKTVLF
jgi:uncharacterized membrane protein YgdD (TMEM256/DUF423 family)